MAGSVNTEKSEKAIEVQLFDVLKEKILWILLVGLVVGGLTFTYFSTMVTPMYSSTSMLYVNNASFSSSETSTPLTQGDITASRSLVDTLVVILNNSTVLSDVIEKTGVQYTYNQLRNIVSASAVNSTEVLAITVTTDNAEKSALLANTIAELLPEKISEIIEGSSTRLVSKATVNNEPVSPGTIKYTAIGAAVSMFAAYVLFFIIDSTDQTVYSSDDIIITHNIPLLGEVPNLMISSKSSYYYKRKRYGYSSRTYAKTSNRSIDDGGNE